MLGSGEERFESIEWKQHAETADINPTPYSLLPTPLLPIDKNIFRQLGIPYFDITETELPSITQGKPLEALLAGGQLHSDWLYTPPSTSPEQQAAAVFCGDSLAALIEKKQGRWKYGYVYARA